MAFFFFARVAKNFCSQQSNRHFTKKERKKFFSHLENGESKMKVLKTDVLIIGGGSAGCLAAIAAKDADPGLGVTIFEKANIKRSGSLATGMDALNIVAVPGISTPEEIKGLLEVSFEYVCEKNGLLFFRKQK
jgi:ribulose 1,5-bisphosphate synthetase/thiazole synthase